MNIGISLKENAYTPEAYAYSEYLTKKGFNIELDYDYNLSNNNDINIYFMGIRPFWKKNRGRALEIHEYQSLSVPSFPKIKDLFKVYCNNVPSGRIFLNPLVKNNFNFNDPVPFIYRDMGVDLRLYQHPSSNPEFDIVYCGSITGRKGLLAELVRLANLSFKILVIGEVSNKQYLYLKKYKNIVLTGRVNRNELPSLFKQCRAGLNYTPNIYPFNLQTSTKTLEYLASGLSVITNRYNWSISFFAKNNIDCIYLDEVNEYLELKQNSCPIEIIKNYEWNNILEKSNLYNFLITMVK